MKATIFSHPEFTAFRQQVQARFEAWRAAQRPGLVALKPGDSPRHLIEALAEALLAALRVRPRRRQAPFHSSSTPTTSTSG